ncbi:PRC-barrel domain-containing protein [Methylophaga nitratireducenticrescens]|uniref:PRC-barrel protein n=1 Tax=Methylophaga nitratireducenticrescens TaxID=754476 RepID=I1XMD0_METNJ|nr:PRC-barrel domain-containing protein [Methylophaga nitratireducenticrescens]
MNSIFRKTLIASALTAMFSTGAIAADDYSKTIDGSDASNQGDMQQNDSSSTHPAMPTHEDEFNQIIDADKPAAGNTAGPEETDRPLTDHQNNVIDEMNETIDTEGPSAGNRADPEETDRPLSDHQSNVMDEMNETIDAEGPSAGNRADPEETDRPLSDHQSNVMDEMNETIDAEGPSAGNRADPEETDRPLSDHQSNVMDEMNETIDAEGPSAGNRAASEETDRPLTDHQSNVTEEEEEEEEISNTQMDNDSDVEMKGQMDRNNDVEMDEQPHGPTGAGTPANRGGLYDMSADDLNGMEVITSDGEDVGEVQKVVISPDNQDIHAVISVGGLLGLGAKTILISLDEINQKNDKLHAKATLSQLEAMIDYGTEDFVELEGDAAVSTALQP